MLDLEEGGGSGVVSAVRLVIPAPWFRFEGLHSEDFQTDKEWEDVFSTVTTNVIFNGSLDVQEFVPFLQLQALKY